MSQFQTLIFTLGNQKYGVNIQQIQSIERTLPLSKVPGTLAFIKGVANLRGAVVPILDLRERFAISPETTEQEERILVADLNGIVLGFLVDSVLDVQSLSTESIEAPPVVVGGIQAEFLYGLARTDDTVLVLLNLLRIVNEAEERQLQHLRLAEEE
ncbi:chemotaxis protein CheW [Alicyclobacillus tolerans]|uniref:chemotaxis protein CheW n=1 Tax=Alicyclobacillus tolerans TaxID=90970 RepID=UPI001F2DF332|nr:chemotaxis protein CheW [Alicyclobacillus tolerans]MCF8567478.1 chemotaxis protein CheW [Alicyclobacillus tolerans]